MMPATGVLVQKKRRTKNSTIATRLDLISYALILRRYVIVGTKSGKQKYIQ